VIEFIPAWQRGLIQKQGRLVLIKSVIAAKPVHHLLVADASDWLLEEVQRWMRAFLWTGKKQISGGQCPVAWDRVCKPLCYGGLGVFNLKLQGLALRARWEWLRRTDPSRPWQGLTMLHDADAQMVFHSLAAIKLGNGNDVLFWLDRWVNGVSILDIAPSVFWVVPLRVRNRRTVAEGLLDSSWVADVSSPLDVQGIAESVRLWLAINNVVRDATIPDSFSWPCAANGVYSAKDTYIALCQGNIRSATASCSWKV
jgi:hypothetical protein